MAITQPSDLEILFVDKQKIRQYLKERGIGLALWDDPEATALRAREMMLAEGIRPEDNEFSRSLLETREE